MVQAGTGFSCVRNIYLVTTTCREEPWLDASYSGKQYGRSCLHLPSFGVRQAAGAVPQEAQGGHRLLDLRRSVVKYNILSRVSATVDASKAKLRQGSTVKGVTRPKLPPCDFALFRALTS